MSQEYHIVVCGSIVPDPLQTLDPVDSPTGPSLKNEMMLPSVLDPWAWHALIEACNLADKAEGSKVWLVSLAPKAKLQQVMMGIAQKASFELVAIDGPANGFTDASDTASALASAIDGIAGLDKEKLLVFGGWQSAYRGSGAVLQMIGEQLGITEQFQGVDKFTTNDDGSFSVLERTEGSDYQSATCTATPAVLGWATGTLPEPANNPQLGMKSMAGIMGALQKAQVATPGDGDLKFENVEVPQQRRETRVENDMSTDDIAQEIVTWIKS